MPKAKRNIGQEILEGIRQLKRGEHGRVMKVPSVTGIRERTGLSQPRFAELLGVSEPARTSRRCLAQTSGGLAPVEKLQRLHVTHQPVEHSVSGSSR